MIGRTELRARFARALSAMYGREVPAYTTLVDVATEVNSAVLAERVDAERLGSIDRVTAERHGAIRLGTPAEMRDVAAVFAGFGMHPVGFYDLRDASASSVPVTSTAFRPTERGELAANPFRVFTSMLMVDDRRFFPADVRRELRHRLADRRLFSSRLLELARRSEAQDGLPETEAAEYVRAATAVFELSGAPVERAWYSRLEQISSVAADIGGVGSTHINHLTPRVLDIDALYAAMTERGIAMIDDIQGPPRWAGPDVLLRQTSFRALAEPRRFRESDGSLAEGELRVRFGEVEQRGIALTPAGREIYDAALIEVERRVSGGGDRSACLGEVWAERFPGDEAGLDAAGLGYFTYRVADRTRAAEGRPPGVERLVLDGVLVREPIVYEDFLPKSAAGIFQSNLTDAGTRDDTEAGAVADRHTMSGVIGREVLDPFALYAAERAHSLRAVADDLGLEAQRLEPVPDAGAD